MWSVDVHTSRSIIGWYWIEEGDRRKGDVLNGRSCGWGVFNTTEMVLLCMTVNGWMMIRWRRELRSHLRLLLPRSISPVKYFVREGRFSPPFSYNARIRWVSSFPSHGLSWCLRTFSSGVSGTFFTCSLIVFSLFADPFFTVLIAAVLSFRLLASDSL